MAKDSLRFENIEVQFLYPFEIREWRNFKKGILRCFNQAPISENPGKPRAIIELEHQIPEESVEREHLKKLTYLYDKRNAHNNNALFDAIEDMLHQHDGHGHELFKTRLKKLKEKHYRSADERFFTFLATILENERTKAVFSSTEKKGTRPYLLKNLPHVVATPSSQDLVLANVETALPNITPILNRNQYNAPYLRLQSNIKLLPSGFGLLKMRCCLFTRKGLDEAIDEIVFSSETLSNTADSKKFKHEKEALSANIKEEIEQAIAERDNPNSHLEKINNHIDQFCHKHLLTNAFIKQNIDNLVDRANLMKEQISTSQAVDIQNLDRGVGWEKEPLFRWHSGYGKGYVSGKLYNYFDFLVDQTIVDPIKERSKEKLVYPFEVAKGSKLESEFLATLSHLERDDSWYAEEGIYPYILTFAAAPDFFKKPGAKILSEIEDHFTSQLDDPRYKNKLARLLMKSPWKKMRVDIDPLKSYLENVFYSDLLYMTVHIRSTLCFYYLPNDPAYEYEKYPELYNSIKYKRELEDTLVAQRVLWYMYSSFNHKVSMEIKGVSKTFESLTSHIKKEEFHQILDELTEITMGIDNRKIAIAEIMEDPLNRKGSTLFAEMVSKSSKAFRLRQLYLTLNDKLERLDMLGLHVNQSTNELSNMVLQETSRATQFTVEIMEAFIIGVYVAQIIDMSQPSWLQGLRSRSALFMIVAISTPLIALPLITLVRKSMSRFRGHSPAWQEWVEKVGLAAGLGMLSILILGILRELNYFQTNPFAMIVLLIGLPIQLYLIWLRANQSFENS